MSGQAGVPKEYAIEITPEMVSASLVALELYQWEDGGIITWRPAMAAALRAALSVRPQGDLPNPTTDG